MVYFTAAHSWRPPGVTVGITAPIPDDILFGPPEQSDAFELGLKSEWLDRRLRFNVASSAAVACWVFSRARQVN